MSTSARRPSAATKPKAAKPKAAAPVDVDDLQEAPEPPLRAFTLPNPDPDDENPVTRVSVGHHPRVSLGAGERFETRNQKLANRLAAEPNLVEVTS